MINPLLSDDPNILAKNLKRAIKQDRESSTKKQAREGMNYYNHENDILNNRIFYIDDDGVLREDKYASNTKIPHGFFPEIVDQKTQVLLSKPLVFECEDEGLKAELKTYYDEEFQVFLQDVVTNASQKGFEYIFARTTAADRLTFQIADSLTVFPVYDDANEVRRIVRSIDKQIIKEGKAIDIHLVDVWDEKQVWFFKAEGAKDYELNLDVPLNPRPHVIAVREDGSLLKREYGTIPFYRYKNNAKETTDLKPIKSLIDDYDIMNAFLSNNLQDFTEAIYVVKGYEGDDLSKLRQNIRSKKTVGVDTEGGVEIQTITIPVEGRKTKMEIDKENIYKFGMAFDSTQIGDGNITNVVIKSRYSLLIMKVNKTEVRIRALLKWINDLVIADINRRMNKQYDPSSVTFEFSRELMVNETDLVANEKTKAETKQIIINSIMQIAPRLDDATVLKLICEPFDLDWEEVQAALEEAGYTQGSIKDTDLSVNANGSIEQVKTGTQAIVGSEVQKDDQTAS